MNASDVQQAVKAAMDAAIDEAGAAAPEVRALSGRVVEFEGLTVSVSVALTATRLVVREVE